MTNPTRSKLIEKIAQEVADAVGEKVVDLLNEHADQIPDDYNDLQQLAYEIVEAVVAKIGDPNTK